MTSSSAAKAKAAKAADTPKEFKSRDVPGVEGHTTGFALAFEPLEPRQQMTAAEANASAEKE